MMILNTHLLGSTIAKRKPADIIVDYHVFFIRAAQLDTLTLLSKYATLFD